MKIISKSKACDIIITKDEQAAVYDFVNAVKVTDISYKEIKAMTRTSPNYYTYELVVESRGIIVAMRTCRNQIEVLDLNNFEVIREIRWKYDKSCRRIKSILSVNEKYIYTLSYTNKAPNISFITRLDLDTYEEELVVRLQERYVFDIIYLQKEDYLLTGKFFMMKKKQMKY